MDKLSLILYISGIIGLCLCIILIGTNFHKKNKFFSIITLLFIFLSVISLGSGTITKLIEKKQEEPIKTVNSTIENTTDNDTKVATDEISNDPSTEDLLFEYKIKNSQFYITITNTSSDIFNGTVHIKQFNKEILVSELDLPLNNLLPKGSSTYTVQDLSSANLLDYEFKGSFSKEPNTSTPYSIESMGVGNGYLRFEVTAQNKDVNTLQSICKTFKNTYTKNNCKGFLIYFIESENQQLDKSYAEYFCNNEGNTSLLTIYDSNITININ